MDPQPARRYDAVVAGGGPAGLLTGLLFARAGVEVAVLEKHADFLRDFRGDTVHASTLAVLDELGLGEAFARLPHQRARTVRLQLDRGTARLADFRRLPGRHQHIAFVPQWDLLDLLAGAAQRYPGFTLLRSTEVVDLLRSGSRVTGVVARGSDGATVALRSRLVVAADGRGSVVRERAGLPLRAFGAPIDVLWFRLPADPGDVQELTFRFSAGAVCILIPRGDYWQCAFVVAKGTAAGLLTEEAAGARRRIAALLPALAARAGALRPADLHVLDVRLDRLRRWSAPGLLCIGDAAHAMSPVGGVGINLAVQDAVAAANLLAGPLRDGADVDRLLPAVQRRRWLPTAITQRFQRQVHDSVLARVLDGDGLPGAGSPGAGSSGAGSSGAGSSGAGVPLPLRVIGRAPALAHVAGRFVGLGVLPEHVRTPEVAPLPGEPG